MWQPSKAAWEQHGDSIAASVWPRPCCLPQQVVQQAVGGLPNLLFPFPHAHPLMPWDWHQPWRCVQQPFREDLGLAPCFAARNSRTNWAIRGHASAALSPTMFMSKGYSGLSQVDRATLTVSLQSNSLAKASIRSLDLGGRSSNRGIGNLTSSTMPGDTPPGALWADDEAAMVGADVREKNAGLLLDVCIIVADTHQLSFPNRSAQILLIVSLGCPMPNVLLRSCLAVAVAEPGMRVGAKPTQ